MTKASFVVAFKGPGVEEGTIDVRDLAPALLALGQAIDAANRTLNGDKVPARIQARAVSPGSFEVSLDVVLSNWEYIKGLLKNPDVEGAKSLLEWLGIAGHVAGPLAGGGLFWLYRRLAGRKPHILGRDEGGITLDLDGQTFVVPLEVMRLYQDIAVNKAIGSLLDTLEGDRVTSIEFKNDFRQPPVEVLTKEDRRMFAIPTGPDEPIVDFVRTMGLSIRSLAFQEGNKWRLFDGQNVITATIEDRDFLERIDRNELRFAKSDVLICDVRTVQRQTVDGLKTEFTIQKVSDYRPAPMQIQLF